MGKRNTASDGKKVRILVVDDHPLIRQGLVHLVGSQSDMEVAGQAGNRADALAAVSKLKPDVAVVDLSLTETVDLSLISEIKALRPETAVLVLSMHEEAFYAERALKAGAQGYIMKAEPLDRVVTAIRRVVDGEVHFSEQVTASVFRKMVGSGASSPPAGIDALSGRELQVFECIGIGLGPNDIGERLHLSVKTIETYRAKIKRKLNLPDASALRRLAVRWVRDNR